MIVKFKSDRVLFNREEQEDSLTIEKIKYVLNNYDRLSLKEFYKMICMFYDVKLEDSDYLNYINDSSDNKFDNVVNIETDVIHKHIESEGHGRDFSWWTVSYRLCLKTGVNCELEKNDKYFTIDEVKKLIQDNKIFPIDYYYEKCDDRLYENRVDNDIKYLIEYKYGRKYEQLLDSDIYFDYFKEDIFKLVNINEIFMIIRRFLINYKCRLECDIDEYYMDECDREEVLVEVNRLIDVYNEKIKLINRDNDKNNDCLEIVSKNIILLVIDYLKYLSGVSSYEWYQDIEIEQVEQILGMLNYNEDKELCDIVNKLVVDLRDPDLCFMLVSNYSIKEWIDFDKMIEIIINFGNASVCYDVLSYLADELDEVRIKILLQKIIDSCDAEINYRVVQIDLPCVDIKKHGEAVIKSEDVWFNYLFAMEIDGADVRGHGEVVIKYGDDYDNLMFISNVNGADINRHREVINKNEKLNEEKSYKKVKAKK